MVMRDRRVVIGVASAAVLMLALLSLTFCVARGRHAGGPPGQPAQHGMLQVEMGKQDSKMEPGKPLRCFVGGQFVGEQTLADCAKKNGVAAQSLDVGLDQTGQMAAAQEGQTALTPLPVVTAQAPPPTVAVITPTTQPLTRNPPPPVAEDSSGGQCLRFVGGQWRDAPGGSLQACARSLFDGRCVRPGDALYGRFGSQTLRLVPGRVEIANDNRSFRTLVEQTQDCSLP